MNPGTGSGARIAVASRSPHKVAEIRRILAGLPVELVGLDALPRVPNVVEDGETFAENAAKKAREYAASLGMAVLADDSGFVVDALGGEPGVYSHRWGGPGLDDSGRNALVLRKLEEVPFLGRRARFACSAAFCRPGERGLLVAEGKVEGYVATRPRGPNGFGYDPIFWVPALARTFGEVPAAVKDRLSHRGAAFRALAERLRGML